MSLPLPLDTFVVAFAVVGEEAAPFMVTTICFGVGAGSPVLVLLLLVATSFLLSLSQSLVMCTPVIRMELTFIGLFLRPQTFHWLKH